MGMGATGGTSGGVSSEINVTPMVDIMLVILIIFMVITPFLQQGVSVALPREMRNPEEDKAIIKESSVVVAITEDGKLYLGKKQIENPRTELKAEIDKKMETKSEDEKIVYIRGDINANYKQIVDAINLVRESGVQHIGLVADKKKGKSEAEAGT